LFFPYKILLLLVLVLTIIYIPEAYKKPLAWVSTVALGFALTVLYFSLKKTKDKQAFLSSSCAFVSLWGIAGAVHYPHLVKASNDPALSLTIQNASSSELTLKVMLIIALVGMPIVIGYTIYLYKIFKGKVQIGAGE
jgi:cytochrome d ubiquinol oxidase subunit II